MLSSRIKNIPDQSWSNETIRPSYRTNHAQIAATGDYRDSGLGHRLPAGGTDIQTEEELALQGLGENTLDTPIVQRPGAWHNADHSLNETQFKHGHLPSEVVPRTGDTIVTQVDQRDGAVFDSYVFDVNPSEFDQVAEVVKNIADRAYNPHQKNDIPLQLEESEVPFNSNPFGGARARITRNARANQGATHIGSDHQGTRTGNVEEDAFSAAVAADNLDYYYNQAPPPTGTPEQEQIKARNDNLGLRRVSIREQQSNLMDRVAQRTSGRELEDSYRELMRRQADDKSILAQGHLISTEEKEQAIAELRSYPGGQFTAVQQGIGDLSTQRQKKTKKAKNNTGFGSHYL